MFRWNVCMWLLMAIRVSSLRCPKRQQQQQRRKKHNFLLMLHAAAFVEVESLSDIFSITCTTYINRLCDNEIEIGKKTKRHIGWRRSTEKLLRQRTSNINRRRRRVKETFRKHYISWVKKIYVILCCLLFFANNFQFSCWSEILVFVVSGKIEADQTLTSLTT